jgi:hypothetical protein
MTIVMAFFLRYLWSEDPTYIGRIEVLSSGHALVLELAELVDVEAVAAVGADVVQDALHGERLVLNLGENELSCKESRSGS